ncbi:MAG: Cell shape-determining protein MreC [Pseudomonadota bacterium]
MAIGSLDRSPPPLFKQGISALSKMLVLSSLSVLLMASDREWAVSHTVRQVVSVVLFPVQWTLDQPGRAWSWAADHFNSLEAMQQQLDTLQRELLAERTKAQFGTLLAQENAQLRRLLDLQQSGSLPDLMVVDVSYEAPDPFATRLVLLKGTQQRVASGAAVMDAHGVVGQVTQVYPFSAELTLLTSSGQLTPVLNARTGQHGLLKGTGEWGTAPLQLEFVDSATDVRMDDVLITSGIDGVYPVGVPVAKVTKVGAPSATSFRWVGAHPMAQVRSLRQVLVQRSKETSP